MKESKKGNSTGLIIIIIILIVLLAGCGYLLLKEKEKNQEPEIKEPTNKEPQPGNTKTKDELKTIEITDSIVTQARKTIPQYLCGGVALNLEKKDRTISELTNEEKLDMVVSIYEDDIIKTAMDESTYKFAESELNKYFQDLSFLDAYKPTTEDVTIIPVKLTFENGNILATSFGAGCEGAGNNGDYLKLLSAQKNEENLVLEFLHYYKEFDRYDEDKNEFISKIYKDKEKDGVIGETSNPEDYQFEKEKFDTYSFTYNIKDGNYQLQNIKYNG